jgi:hypothetical protein
VGPRAGLDTEVRGKILCPCWGSNPDRPVIQSIDTILTELPTVYTATDGNSYINNNEYLYQFRTPLNFHMPN